jgi:NADH-quinone oxidoreductase subunit C
MSKDIEREQAIAGQAAGEPLKDQAEAQLISALRETHADAVSEVIQAFGEITFVVPREHIVELCEYLKTAPQFGFNLLADICGVDRGPEEDPRFEVNYHLFSTTRFHRLRLKVVVSEEDASVPTVTGVWRTANWHERETFDMFGVRFDGHPDLRRILLPDDWQGHALRKDFPLRGYEPYSLS